jgi:hypothetical protein
MGAVRASAPAFLGFVLFAAAARAGAAVPDPRGVWDSPLGRIRITGDGTAFRGTLAASVARCGLAKGDEVLRATLLDDSLAGELRVCLAGARCPVAAWANAVLLVGDGRLSGAVHVEANGCRAASAGPQGGVTFTRRPATPGKAPAKAAKAPAARRERARALLRDGAAYLHEGAFERARERFLEAIDADPRVPEAYNGVGVTYRMRNDLAEALAWYKQALAIDPDFGDAWYNLACVHALRGEPALALRYLQIAAVNGYATAEGIEGDPDLEGLRGEPAYRALVEAKL